MRKPVFQSLALLIGLAVPTLGYGGLAFHVSSASAKAKTTASSPKPAINKQQCIADPAIDLSSINPDFDDDTSYLVGFGGTMSWTVPDGVPFSLDGFAPDPAGTFTVGVAPGAFGVAGPPAYPTAPIAATGSATFNGYFAPYFDSTSATPPTPPLLITHDQDTITGNFTTVGIPIVTYTVDYSYLLIYDSSTNKLIEFDNPGDGSFETAVAHTYDLDPNVPEPTAAALCGLAITGLLARRRSRRA